MLRLEAFSKRQMAQIAKTKVLAPSPPSTVQMLKPFREPQKQMAKTNQFGCGRPTGAADLKHANQWWGAKAKQLKPENCRPGNKQSGSFSLSPPFLSILGRSSPPELASGARQFTLTMLPLFQRGCCFRKETDWAISGRASQSSRLVITSNQPSRQDSLGPS